MGQGTDWATFWDRANRRAIIMSTTLRRDEPPDYWTFVEHDTVESKPGIYDIWRDQGKYHPQGRIDDGDVVCIEVHLDQNDGPLGFPDHLLSRDLLGSQTLWVSPDDEMPSFMCWSGAGSERPYSDRLAGETQDFLENITSFAGFTERVFTVGMLQKNRNWTWAKRPGVYVFIHNETPVYVGCGLRTVGERIANQLGSQSDPAWRRIVTDQETQVRVFTVADNDAHIASALEMFLIDRLKPEFNRRRR